MTNHVRRLLMQCLGVTLLLFGGCNGCHHNAIPIAATESSGSAGLATLTEQPMEDVTFEDAPSAAEGGSFVFCCDQAGSVRIHVGKITITPMAGEVIGLLGLNESFVIDMDTLGLTVDDLEGPFEFEVNGQPFGTGSPAEAVSDGITVDVYATSCNFDTGSFDLLLAAVADEDLLDPDSVFAGLPPIFFHLLEYEVRNVCPKTPPLIRREPPGCVATFADGSYTVAGTFAGTTTWGVGPTNEMTRTAGGAVDLFVAHYDAKGNLVWLDTSSGAAADDQVITPCISCLPDGCCIVAGGFGSTAPNETGTVTFGTDTMTSRGRADVFVAKYDSAGAIQWIRQDGGIHALVGEQAKGVATFDDGSCVVTGGYYEGGSVFGTGEPNRTNLPNEGGFDFYVARYTPNGELQWARRASGPGLGTFGGGVTANDDGSCTVQGALQGPTTFGAGETNETTIESYDPAKIDAFIARYEQNGDLGWAQRMGGPGALAVDTVIPGGITSCGDGTSYVGGAFRGALILGEGASQRTLNGNANGELDMFIARYAADGTVLWAHSEGDTDAELVVDVDCVATDDSCIVVGTSTPEFTGGEIPRDKLFLHRYAAPAGTALWREEQGGTGVVTAMSVGAFPDGSSIVTGQFTGTTIFGTPPDTVTLNARMTPDHFHAKYDPDGNAITRP